MLRRFAALCLSLTLILSLAACGGEEASQSPASAPESSSASEEAQEPASQESEASSEAPSEASSEASSEGEAAPAGDVDVSGAVDASTTSDTSPVPLGQWAKTARYATEDETYHTVYVRVNKVTTSTDDAAYVEEAVALHNQCSYDFAQIDLSAVELPDDVELCVMDYEVYVPAEFPTAEYGIVEPSMSFSQSNIGGGGIPAADGTSVYIGLGSNTEDLATEADPSYQVGNVYAFRNLFTMVKGYTDYVFEFTSYPDGTVETSSDVMYTAYFANK